MEAVFKHCTKYKAFAVVSPSASYNIQRAEVKKCNKECDATLCAFRAVFLIFDGFFVVCGAVDPSLIPAHLLSNQQSADVYVIRFSDVQLGYLVRSPLCPKGNVCADRHICETISYILVVVVVKYIIVYKASASK